MTLKKSGISLITALALSCGLTAVAAPSAFADGCQGDNSRDLVSSDPMSGSETWNVKIDSCHASQLVDAYGQAKDAAGLAGLLGSKWWPVDVTAGVFFAWAWANQDTLKNCAANGTGVQFQEISGIVVGCSPQ